MLVSPRQAGRLMYCEHLKPCKGLQVTSIALCGLGVDLEGKVDYALRVPSRYTPRIQESHIMIGHMICVKVELQIFGHLDPRQE